MPKSKGFTLVELLIAVAVIGVISAIGVSTYGGVREKAQDSVRKSDLQGIAAALELYYAKHGGYLIDTVPCPKESNILYTSPDNEGFLKFITGILPKDPKLNTNYCYQTDETGDNFKLVAILDNNTPYELTSENYIAQATTPLAPGATTTPTPTPTPTPTAAPIPSPTLTVFTTSSTYTGDLGGLFGADQKCKALADSPGSQAPQGKLWRAWLSDSSTNAKDRISDGKYVRIDGQTIATSKADLLDGSIALPIDLTEQWDIPSIEMNPQAGTLEAYPYVWTGTQGNGNQKLNETCGNWNKPETADGAFGVVRGGGIQGNEWSYFSPGGNQCQTFRRHLYCFEQVSSQPNPDPGCLKSYQDFDNDTFTIGPAQYFCGVAELPFGYRSSASAADDCYDMNPNAKPDQTQYFPQDRGDGSYDYDCNGSSIPQYPKVGESCASYPISTSSNCSNSFTGQACYTTGRTTNSADCGIDRSYTSNSPTMYQDDEGGCLPTLANRFRGKLPCR